MKTFIALFLCFFVAFPVSAQRFIKVAGTTNDLLAQPVPDIHTVTLLRGYSDTNENFNGMFQYIRSSTATPDGIRIFTPTFGAGVGRYHLLSSPTIYQTNFTLITTNLTVIVNSNIALVTTNISFVTTNGGDTNITWTFITPTTTNVFYTTNLFGITNAVPGIGTSTDEALTRWDGATGRLLQNSVGILSDSGAMTGLASLTATNGVTAGWFKSGVSNSASILVVDGDSRTQGGLACAAPAWALGVANTEPFTLFNVAIGGNRLLDQSPLAFANVDSKLSWIARRNVVVIWAGVNDFRSGSTGAQVYSLMSGYCDTRRKAGWSVIVCTEVSAKESGIVYDTQKNDFNALVRAHWSEFADGLADLGGNNFLGADGAYATNTYFCDEIHLTVAANVIVAAIVSASIERLIEGDDARGNLTSQGIRVSGEINSVATGIGDGGLEMDWSGGAARLISFNRTTGAWRPLGIGSLYTTFANNSIEYARLTNGLFGIGTTNPQTRFVVSANGSEGFEYIPGFTTNLNILQGYNRAVGNYVAFDGHFSDYRFNIDAATEALRIYPAGTLAIAGFITNTAQTANSILGTDVNKRIKSVALSGLTFDGTTLTAAAGSGIGGSDTQVQFNDGGVFGGDAGFTYYKTTDSFTVVGGITNSVLTASALTASDANKRLKSVVIGANLTYDGTTLAASGGGAGTVTSVALTMPSPFSVAGSPVTTSGTLAVTGVDPGADKLIGWDDTGNVLQYFNLGVGLVYDAATDTLSSTNSGAAGGDFVGPASATDNAVVRFDGVTGKLGQNSVVIVSDAGAVTGVATLDTGQGANELFDMDQNVQTSDTVAFVGLGLTGSPGTITSVNDFLIAPAGSSLIRLDAAGAGYTSVESTMLVTGAITNQAITASKLVMTDANQRLTALPDPGSNRIVLWDDSDGLVTQAILGSQISYNSATDTLSVTNDPIQSGSDFSAVKVLPNGILTSIFEIAMPSGSVVAIQVEWSLDVTDGTDFQSVSGIDFILGSNKAGTVNSDFARTVSSGVHSTSGLLLLDGSSTDGETAKITYKQEPTSDLTTPTINFRYRVKNFGGKTITQL